MRGFVCMMQTMKLLICKQQLITSGNNGEPNWSYIPSKGKSTKTQFEFVSEIKKLVQKSANATDKIEQDSISRQRCLWTHQACHMILLSMTITYPVGVACSAIMYFIIKQNGNFLKKVSD